MIYQTKNTSRSGARKLRGATLIEMMIVMVIAFAISALALSTLLEVKRVQTEATFRNQMFRDVQLVMDQLSYDLNYFGLGVPDGLANRDLNDSDSDSDPPVGQTALSNGPASQMRPPMRLAKPTGFAFVGDLPFPNAELPGVVIISGWDSSNTDRPHVTSEISPCVPPDGEGAMTYSCTPEIATSVYASRVPSDYTAADRCTVASEDFWTWGTARPKRLCPWGQNKWQPSDVAPTSSDFIYLTVVGTDGRWNLARWDGDADSEYSGSGLHLDHWMDPFHNLNPALMLNSDGAGTGYISHLDRVFYTLEDGTLYRRHCWGRVWDTSVDASSSSWPAVSNTTLTTSFDPDFCSAPDEGTRWEPVVTDIDRFSVAYYDRNGGAVDVSTYTPQLAASVRVVEVRMRLQRDNVPVVGRSISNEVVRRIQLRHANGIVGVDPASGGCSGDECEDD